MKEITGDDFVRKAVFVNNQTGEETVYEAPKDSTFGLFVLLEINQVQKFLKENCLRPWVCANN